MNSNSKSTSKSNAPGIAAAMQASNNASQFLLGGGLGNIQAFVIAWANFIAGFTYGGNDKK